MVKTRKHFERDGIARGHENENTKSIKKGMKCDTILVLKKALDKNSSTNIK